MNTKHQLHITGEAEAFLPLPDNNGKPIRVFGTEAIRATFDDQTLQQALNSRSCPGVTEVVINPDAHVGYGAPIGCVMASPTHIYPGPVGVDIKCSMSLLQFHLPEAELIDKKVRRALINAIVERTPTGPGRGARSVKKSRNILAELGVKAVTEGASDDVLRRARHPATSGRCACEDRAHTAHDGMRVHGLHVIVSNYLRARKRVWANFEGQGPANSAATAAATTSANAKWCDLSDQATLHRSVAETFGLRARPRRIPQPLWLARPRSTTWRQGQFRDACRIAVRAVGHPAARRAISELVYAPLGTPEANAYIDDMSLGANFATVNHLLINALVLEAFQEVLPGVTGDLVYFISHNIARQEIVDNRESWVHRKGATRAFPAGHHALKDTKYAATGHPILLPGNPRDGSVVMVAQAGAEKSCFSVNHGAGRALGRKNAMRTLDQKTVDADFETYDILTNCRQYPKDEAPAAYKDFKEVLRSVEVAGLAKTVASLKARFVIKDGSEADD